MAEEAPKVAKIMDMDVEQLRSELEKERQSKSALENMIIVSSLNMIGKIEVLEKKHEAQIEQLRTQIQQYANKEAENNIITKSLEEANAKLRAQLADVHTPNVTSKKTKEHKGKRKEKDKDRESDTHTNGDKKKSHSFSGTGRGQVYEDDDRDLVAEALGTFGEIEKKPRSEGRSRRAKVVDNPSWDDSANDTTPHKRRKTDPPMSPDGSPPQGHSPVLSESQMNVYTSNYSNLFAASNQHTFPPESDAHRAENHLLALESIDSLSAPKGHTSQGKHGSGALTSSSNSPHEKLLNDVHQLQIAQKERLERMQQTQKHCLSDRKVEPGSIAALETEQQQLRSQMETEVNTLRQLDKHVLLEPNQLFRLDFLLQDLRIQQRQLELFQSELQQFMSSQDNSKCHAALVITKQPFPMVISKFKQLQEEQLVVQLLSGANVDFVSFGQVKAELICHTKAITKGASTSTSNPNASLKKHIDRDTQQLDLLKGVAKFPLKFLTGTRKSCVNLRFVVQVKTNNHSSTTIESNTSQPFIVITNDCQWEGSEGTLLKNEAFNDQIEIPWAQFVNILQRHFLKATRQSPIQPTRPLSLYDFSYLSMKFFINKNVVSHKNFDNFWAWFGKSLQTLRYKRHISTLWQNGLIFMFLTRDKVTQILRVQDPGSFIILFSEAYPGQLEISYVAAEKQGTPPSSPMSNLNSSSNGLTLPMIAPSSADNTPSESQGSTPGTPILTTPKRTGLGVSSGSVPTPQSAISDGLASGSPSLTPTSSFSTLAPLSPAPLGTPSKSSMLLSPLASPSSFARNPLIHSIDGANNINASSVNNNNLAFNNTTSPLSRSASSVLSLSSSFGTPLPSSSHGYASTTSGFKIKHYLVQPNDTSGSKRTLPDFLNECPQFTHVLQLNVSALNTTTDWASCGMPSFKKQPKDQVLEPYYSKRGAMSPGFIANGYDPL